MQVARDRGDEFVAAIKLVAFDSEVSETALQPKGRQPYEVLVRMWDWYTSLPEHDRALVRHAMRIAAYGAVSNFLAVLDGVAAIDNPPHGELRLTYLDPDGSLLQLNGPAGGELHGLWTSAVFPNTEALPD